MLDKSDKESIDTHIYRKAENKSIQIGKVETLLKQNAIDRYLYENVNVISSNSLNNIKMKPIIKIKINSGKTYYLIYLKFDL